MNTINQNQKGKATDVKFSPKIASLIGIVPPFDKEQLEQDERLNDICKAPPLRG